MNDTEKKEMLDSLRGIVHEAGNLAAKNQQDALDKAIADYDKKFDKLEAKINSSALIGDSAVAKESEIKKAFNLYARSGAPSNQLSSGSDKDVGILVPEEIAKEIVRYSMDGNPMRELANVVTISTDSYANLDEYTDAGCGWIGEGATTSETTTPNTGKQTIYVRDMYAQPYATQQVIDDAAYDLEGFISGSVSRAFSKLENTAFFTGTGITSPFGILSATTVADASWARGKVGYIAAGSTSAISGDCLIDLQDSLADEYSSNATWLMKKPTFTALRKLKAGTSGANLYLLWNPEIVNGKLENMFMGSPVRKCSGMSAIAENAYPVAYGDFRQAYNIVDRVGIRLIRDNITSKGKVIFYTTKRVGGGIRNTEAYKLLKMAAS